MSSKWDEDQQKYLDKYLAEKSKIDQIIKKEVQFFKNNMEEIDKRYTIVLNEYLIQMSLCTVKKNKIEELIESKYKFEKVLDSMNKELHNFAMISNISKIKNYIFNYGFNLSDKKRQIIELEIQKILPKIKTLQDEINIKNNDLKELVIIC
jgi:hypothetical protein